MPGFLRLAIALVLCVFFFPSLGQTANQPPNAIADLVPATEDTVVEFRPLSNDSDPNGDPIHLISLRYEGAYALAGLDTVILQPPSDFFGNLQLSYIIADSRDAFATGTVTITVAPVNDPPFAFNDSVKIELGSVTTINLRASDPDDDKLDFELIQPPRVGRIQSWDSSGKVDYRAPGTGTSSDSFTFQARDGKSESAIASVTIQLTPPIDADADGMPDTWEREHDVNNPATDPDGDGLTNLAEYLANTDPRDPNSVVKLTAIQLTTNRATLKWNAVGQVRYRVQFSPAIGTQFTNIVRSASEELFNQDDGTSGIAEFTTSVSGIKGFYRVLVVP